MTLALLLTALLAGAPQAEGRAQAQGEVVDVTRAENGTLSVVLALEGERELTLRVTPDTQVLVDGEKGKPDELEDAVGAQAKVRYRETADGPILESIELSWPDEAP